MNLMSNSLPSVPDERIPSMRMTLRHLFLTIFLRGHSSQALQKQKVPGSIGQKLALTLFLYALFGIIAVAFVRMPIFALSVYLHTMTFAFLGMFLASSAGAVLFNKEEADILLHRPISPKVLLWAKISVLLEVSLWIAGAFNLAGFFVGLTIQDGGWRFVLAHVLSVGMEAAFCAGCVVMVYQLCLRWCGRERLDGLITTSQVILSIVAVLGSQILPRLVIRDTTMVSISKQSWWIAVFPPAWFAGFDDAMSGQFEWKSWTLATFAIVATLTVLWIAFDRLANEYGSGVQRLSETVSTRSQTRSKPRWIDVAINLPPLRWWLRDPVERASFLLTTAYLIRDRDVKLRVYPGMAPMMIMPIMMLYQDQDRVGGLVGGFGIAFAGSFLSVVIMMGLSLLQYSQQWQASDIFRVAPLPGPASLCHGARKAILCWLAFPVIVSFAVVVWFVQRDFSLLPMLLPGLIALPVFALVPCLGGNCVPFSLPVEDAKSASNGLKMMGITMLSFVPSGLALFAFQTGWFLAFLVVETLFATVLYLTLYSLLSNMKWRTLN